MGDGRGGGGEGEEGREGGEVAARGGGDRREVVLEEEEGVSSRPPMTGEGRRVRERVATPGACTEGGGREGGAGEEEERWEGEAGLPAEGGGMAGESSNWPERVSDRLLLCVVSSDVAPPPPPPPPCPPLPPMAVAVAMTITAFWGRATVVRLPRRSP